MTQPSVILATASYDHTIRFWEAKSGRCYRTIQYPDSQVNRLEITPNKHYLAAAGNPHIRLFDVNSNSPQPVMSYDQHTNNVMAVGFQCDGNWMYSGSEDGTVKIWDLRAPVCQMEYESRAAVNTVVLHPNQTELISGDQNGNIRVWDLTANSCSCELFSFHPGETGCTNPKRYRKHLASTFYQENAWKWLLVPEVDTAVRSLTVMWDGSLVVAANNHGTCYVWRLMRGTQTMTNFEPLHKLQAHNGYILKCLLSPEFCEPHRYLATASSDHTVKIWNVDGFTLEKTLIGHQRWVWDCVFSVDGAYLITGTLAPLLIQLQDSGPCKLVKTSRCIKDTTRQPLVAHSMMELNPRHVEPRITSWFACEPVADNVCTHRLYKLYLRTGAAYRVALVPALRNCAFIFSCSNVHVICDYRCNRRHLQNNLHRFFFPFFICTGFIKYLYVASRS
ncbi:hypothetical protein JRO89_XS11G0108200 [Xanthoceras sorbifolium]|uniref:Target of rapamycin complex subunit LST8 n=1 Tax=Xanthoceras sorbifolium TaxID=99658 RepID=A0ABQ8HFA7_9ROSI|nr:hypothetical protein JRO89_XS11G0108200 [Xanthoceras sorbifolium]